MKKNVYWGKFGKSNIVNNREKWQINNAMNMYKKYFLEFTVDDFHSLGLILDHLETIDFHTRYDEELEKYYYINT